MKQYKIYLINAIITVVIYALLSVGTALASTGCFSDSNGHWAETFICWLKENGLTSGYPDGTYKPDNFVTRAEMAVLLQKAASTGEIRVNIGPNSWNVSNTQPTTVSIYRFDTFIGFTSSIAPTYATFLLTPDFTSVLYGRKLSLIGFEYCYVASPAVNIVSVQGYHHIETSDWDLNNSTWFINDATDRADAGCPYYRFSPIEVDQSSILSVWVYASWKIANTDVNLGRATFYFEPTEVLAP